MFVGGALTKDVLAEVFRGKFVDGLRKAFAQGELGFHGRFAALDRARDFKALGRKYKKCCGAR